MYQDYSALANSSAGTGMSAGYSIGCLIIAVLTVIGWWKLFAKAGKPGWAAIVPFYNLYMEFEVVYGKGIKFLTLLIPIYNIYVAIKFLFDLAKVYGKEGYWGVLMLLIPIAMPIFAFQKDLEYQGPIQK